MAGSWEFKQKLLFSNLHKLPHSAEIQDLERDCDMAGQKNRKIGIKWIAVQ